MISKINNTKTILGVILYCSVKYSIKSLNKQGMKNTKLINSPNAPDCFFKYSMKIL